MTSAIVVGAGLFGSIIARKLRLMGIETQLLNWKRAEAGSTPAACLIKPSWVSGLGKDVVEPSMALLNELYGIEDISFKVGPIHQTVHWVNPLHILSEPSDNVNVLGVNPSGGLNTSDGYKTADIIVIAAGVWCNQMLPEPYKVPGLQGRLGMAFTWDGQIDEPFISPWAPYRQLVAFNRGPNEIWCGDGSAIKDGNWGLTNELASLARCQKALGFEGREPKKRLLGARPYVPDAKPCYLKRYLPNLWVATGGAKNGTLAAAWCAHQIGETYA
ncbi:MAG: hypothetical protein EBU81_05690 [Proteobacteria bacterium]|nr:hypothetical protein [Pseudomonadota bacterium]